MNGTKPNLTGWLILLMVILGMSSVNGIGKEITDSRRLYEQYFSQYPSLQTAVLVYQCVLFGSACGALYTVWMLFQRLPGTLFLIKRAFVMTMLLRIVAGWIFIISLPAQFNLSVKGHVTSSIIVAGYGFAWYLYLARSKRVNAIYASPER